MQKSSDQRLRKIREIFLRIRLIKLNAWERIFVGKIAECRKDELHYLNIDAFYWTLMSEFVNNFALHEERLCPPRKNLYRFTAAKLL